jgi:AraC family transcriptional regulator of adaptative response / DNA-3-methyladenine glycosylase II
LQDNQVVMTFEHRYRVLQSKDRRFDGQFVVAVRSTHIYCRPSCPAITPKPENVTFLPTAAAAQAAGYRACLRCRPDATPGSPEWDLRADLAGRAMRLIADGVVDREGVRGLARRLAYSERHLNRQLVSELGAGPLALARAHRAQTARVLIETTDLSFTSVARAGGFSSVRQFNDTVRELFARTPSELRSRSASREATPNGALTLRLSYRQPLDVEGIFTFLAARAVPGVEEGSPAHYRRTVRLAHGPGIIDVRPDEGDIRLALQLSDLRDVGSAVERSRRLLDLDADPLAIQEILATDPLLAPLVKRNPGNRVPGHIDGQELAIRSVIGQHISVAAARTLTARLVERRGEPLGEPHGSLTHLFPEPQDLAQSKLPVIGLPMTRRRALKVLTRQLAAGEISVEPGTARDDTRQALLAIPGIGPWTAGYIAMRALKDPDVYLAGDAGLRRAMARLADRSAATAQLRRAEHWRPWRSYAVQQLWCSLPQPRGAKTGSG